MKAFVKAAAAATGSEPKKPRPRGESVALEASQAPSGTPVDDDSDDGMIKVSKKEFKAVAALATETARFVRSIAACVYLTFVFPANVISEELTEEGKKYGALAHDKATKKNKKTAKPPCANKWCRLIVAIYDYIVDNKGGLAGNDATSIDEVENTLMTHMNEITDISLLDAANMHCEHRITYDSKTCILVLHSMAYPKIIVAITTFMRIMTKVAPTEGPVPPTKAERRALKFVKGKGSKD